MFAQSPTRHEQWVVLVLFAIAGDVLSNAAFALVGLAGFIQLRRGARVLGPAVRASLYFFFTGLFLTALGSTHYHLDPTNATLVLDRLPMTIAFAGVFGAVVGERVARAVHSSRSRQCWPSDWRA